jgi:fumarylacetoacetate (FAA) hydrolase
MKLVSFTAGDGILVGALAGETVRQLAAPSMIEWLSGVGREAAGPEYGIEQVRLLAPLPVPASYRDFMTFESHAKRAFGALANDSEHQVPAQWYVAPAFYFGNHHAFVGPDEAVARPAGVECLDFELEIGAVVGQRGDIAGFTLLNDWSARDVQRREGTIGLGLHKCKDFANSMGPWLVTADELDYRDGRLRLTAEVVLNGDVIVRTDNFEQHFPWTDMIVHAARGTRVVPGDVLGSGTLPGGSLIDGGAMDSGRWLAPGDVVTLRAEGLGELSNVIVEGAA